MAQKQSPAAGRTARGDDQRPYYVYYLGDFDRAGRDAGRSLQEKLTRFAAEKGITVVFETVGVTLDQIRLHRLPTRVPKRKTVADLKWPHAFACELDALPPDQLRHLVQGAINRHLSGYELQVLKIAEESEREWLRTREALFCRSESEAGR
ncbi:hypothetical protein [Enterovirga aerilata]|uniref:Uncharacterized protein n=1 Tax=Enterovirga aerilata TaxID=2730920 RepID=A0A849I248_9HYPH|nr:hypothetical protein [Enterovirga sp. DB1703]NNM71431.1 hypothetical protein [Enterovirga sp. DB1703]